MDINNLSSNWKKLQATLKTVKTAQSSSKSSLQHALKRKREQIPHEATAQVPKPRKKPRTHKSMARNGTVSRVPSSIQDIENSDGGILPRIPNRETTESINAGLSTLVEVGKYIGLDCEMVGVGPNPDRESALARVSIVNYNGDQVYDSYVLPPEVVTDWRTHVSGVSPKHMKHARTLKEVRTDVAGIFKDRILVGHAIRNDLEALMIDHPQRDIRDTARHPPYRKLAGGGSPRLKTLASELLGLEIQDGEHSSIEDARACMLLFRRDKAAFEREHSKKWPLRTRTESQEDANDKGSTPKSRKKKKKKKR